LRKPLGFVPPLIAGVNTCFWGGFAVYRLLSVLLLLSPFAFSQFTYQTVDIPGATSTPVRGINSTNEIVGFYRTTSLSSCTDYDLKVPNCAQHGFKIVSGVLTKLDVPNSVSTVITGVNDFGDLVGYYQNSDGSYHGFLWLHTNTIETLDMSNNQGLPTVPMGVNKSLKVAGGLWQINAGGTFALGGFVWVNGTFQHRNLGTAGCTNCTSVNGISNNGIIVGQTFRNDFWNAFLKVGKDNDFWTQTGDTFATGVNNNTDVVGIGTSSNGWFAKHIELNEGTNDGVEVTPLLLKVIDPSATTGTLPFGLNAARTVVGAYGDSTGMHGFIATPTF
jgi:hypothetical protein